MYDILKNIATTNNWEFTYARKDYANLFDEVEQPNIPYIFLDPVVSDTNFGEQNEELNKTYSGTFMILVSSDIDDEDYDTKYQDHIKPLITGAIQTIKTGIQCDGTTSITTWRETEVINVFDYNLDGVIITYSLIN